MLSNMFGLDDPSLMNYNDLIVMSLKAWFSVRVIIHDDLPCQSCVRLVKYYALLSAEHLL